ncbi:hypothetical protein GP2_027_00460 [Gordonia paraffinivorans NBRC 108238]|uniref:Uncharacterized protein n=2 Tax=Gordonia paraffinivorans TaxID=175628 RepID=A0ABQ0IMW4_9ACTN|nr:hypothetical protein GP2_027_00460 [Gordonia paraffinivorans NBRC 108238]
MTVAKVGNPVVPRFSSPDGGLMTKTSMRGLLAAVLAGGIITGGMSGAGVAHADGGGVELEGVSNGDCTATIKVTNYTNSTFFQPDWWFAEENDPDMVNRTDIPATMEPPWREESGIAWPIARWVGDPPLRSGLAPGFRNGTATTITTGTHSPTDSSLSRPST